MDPIELGICAIFRGVEQTALKFEKSQAEIQECKMKLFTESSIFIKNVKNMINDIINSIGTQKCADMFEIPEEILKIIVMDEDTLRGLATKRPKIEIDKKRFPTVTQKIEEIRSQPVCLPDVKTIKSFEDLKIRIVSMYNKGINLRTIQAIYDIPSAGYVHTWGDFGRVDYTQVETNKKLQANIRSLKAEGQNDTYIANLFMIKSFRVSELLGDYTRCKPFINSQDIIFGIQNYMEYNDKDKIINFLGISDHILQIYLEEFKNSRFQFDRVFENDDYGDWTTKLELVEHYFICNRHLERAIKKCSSSINKIVARSWIDCIIEKTNKYFI